MEADPQVDEKWMHVALDEAVRARDAGEVPVGAVIVREGELLAGRTTAPFRFMTQRPMRRSWPSAPQRPTSGIIVWGERRSTSRLNPASCAPAP